MIHLTRRVGPARKFYAVVQWMPTVAREGQFRFVVNTRETDFEPPHVHVWVGGEDVCRIELNSGRFMDEPPPGEYRNILQAYLRHVDAIRRTWDEIHHR